MGDKLFLPLRPDAGPQEREAVERFTREVVAQARANARRTNRAMHVNRVLVTVLYVLLFTIGVGAAVASVYRGVVAEGAGEALATAAIAGLSAASFFAFFLARPLESLERNAIYSQWLAAAVNSYWIRLAYFSELETIDADLRAATADLVAELDRLAQHHAVAISKAATPSPPSSGTSSAPASEPTSA